VFRLNVLRFVFSIHEPEWMDQPWAKDKLAERFSEWFGHSGFDRKGRPADLAEALVNASRLLVVTTNGDTAAYEWFRCSTPLIGTSVELLPPFDAPGMAKAQLSPCLKRPKEPLDRSIALNITVAESGRIEYVSTMLGTKPDEAPGTSQDILQQRATSWVNAVEAATRDPKCRQLKLPKERWPDWNRILIDFRP